MAFGHITTGVNKGRQEGKVRAQALPTINRFILIARFSLMGRFIVIPKINLIIGNKQSVYMRCLLVEEKEIP